MINHLNIAIAMWTSAMVTSPRCAMFYSFVSRVGNTFLLPKLLFFLALYLFHTLIQVNIVFTPLNEEASVLTKPRISDRTGHTVRLSRRVKACEVSALHNSTWTQAAGLIEHQIKLFPEHFRQKSFLSDFAFFCL